jgi:hypothetical protein
VEMKNILVNRYDLWLFCPIKQGDLMSRQVAAQSSDLHLGLQIQNIVGTTEVRPHPSEINYTVNSISTCRNFVCNFQIQVIWKNSESYSFKSYRSSVKTATTLKEVQSLYFASTWCVSCTARSV